MVWQLMQFFVCHTSFPAANAQNISPAVVPVNAVLFMPHILSCNHRRSDVLGVGLLADTGVRMDGQSDKDCEKSKRANQGEDSRLILGHRFPLCCGVML